jgi:inorganic pyrophosphatase
MPCVIRSLLAVVLVSCSLAAQAPGSAPLILPAAAAAKLDESLKAASAREDHFWRDAPPLIDGLVNAYIEVPLGARDKKEFDMSRNALSVDRVIPESMGGYPVNYGFVPQTVSYDGDPFDVLVLGPAIEAGKVVRGVAVGLMLMEDEKGLDSKVVISRVDEDGKPLHELTAADQARIGEYFNKYKADDGDDKTWSKVPGWSTAQDGLSYVSTTHVFFQLCRNRDGACDLAY